jgi:hypothetical protein
MYLVSRSTFGFVTASGFFRTSVCGFVTLVVKRFFCSFCSNVIRTFSLASSSSPEFSWNLSK